MNRLLGWKGHAYVGLLARLYLGAVFLAACYHKILDPHAFALDVATYQLLPLWAVNAMAVVLPWLELVCGVLLVVGWRSRPAAALVAGMMVMFIVALGWVMAQELEMSCGCFASNTMEEDPISWATALRDAAWLLLALYVMALDRRPLGLECLRGPTKT